MQWADLRGLRSSTRRVARMTTIAARRRLPLLQQLSLPHTTTPTIRQSFRADHGPGTRLFSTQPQHSSPDQWGKKKPSRREEPKSKSPSLFEELFPNDVSSSSNRRNSENTNGDSKGKVKVRFMTSTDPEKSEATEYRLRQLERKNRSGKTGGEAAGKIADFFESRAREKEKKDKAVDGESSSIFNELFSVPGSGAAGATAGATAGAAFGKGGVEALLRNSQADQNLSEEKSVDHNDLQSWIDSLPKDDAAANTASSAAASPEAAAAKAERPAMLILSNASPNLLETDFYRIGPQGQHLDGWSASIRKVMQAYDYSTLEPMDRYFILFDSHTAAAAYQREAQRLHALAGRSLASPAAGLTSAETSSISAPSNTSTFSLAAPSKTSLSLHLYKLNRATETRLETFSIQGLLSMTPEPPPRANAHVVLSLDGGTLDQRSLSHWIRRDARDRNLGWPVQHLRAYFAPKVDRRTVTASESPAESAEGLVYDDVDEAPAAMGADSGRRGTPDALDETAPSARFVVSFPDVHEARRFVRAWHRKELVLTNDQSVVVNTHVVW
ncbi:hypothetical protein BDP55DRAFT_644835 [Colletotrichum godetiae]|uniref:Uncharacterized protein n=1 Tax=Colletotrichum godetiae TaxID=1209918 RepID=A0AAJ0F3U7_9PEZI|nr:uncharacterized protein BDP55DRAFT_644835 [Colletotrichum godetiae]KAK1699780.1 hypothetical protein BDP55DRAFT_644835 [Colletotrichum godetiae]